MLPKGTSCLIELIDKFSLSFFPHICIGNVHAVVVAETAFFTDRMMANYY